MVDNEAGMEYISRGIVNKIELLFIVGTPAKSSIQAALRINQFTKELGIKPNKKIFIINQADKSLEEEGALLKDFEKVIYVNFDENVKNKRIRKKEFFLYKRIH